MNVEKNTKKIKIVQRILKHSSPFLKLEKKFFTLVIAIHIYLISKKFEQEKKIEFFSSSEVCEQTVKKER